MLAPMSRRANLQGSIKRRTRNGHVEYVVRVPLLTFRTDARGRRVREQAYAIAGKLSEAEAERARLVAERERGVDVAGAGDTLEAFVAYWFEHRLQVKPRTRESYELTLRKHVLPILGRKPLREITVADVDAMVAEIARPGTLAPTSVRYCLTVLRAALGEAERLGRVDRNVARLARPPKVVRREVDPYEADEARAILEAFAGHRLEAIVAVMVGGGARVSEVLALRWSDVDLDEGVAAIRKQLGRRGTAWAFVSTKSDAGVRDLELPGFAVAALRRHRTRQLEARLWARRPWGADVEVEGQVERVEDLVFTGANGRPMHRRQVLRGFQDRVREVGLPVKGLKELRHTAATLMHEAGATPRDIAAGLGHANTSVTLNIYTHVLRRRRRGLADAMDRVVGGEAGAS